MGTGVPTNNGGGNSVLSRILPSSASAVAAINRTDSTETVCNIFFIIESSLDFLGSDDNFLLGADGFVRLMNDIFAGKRLIRRAIQFGRAANGIEEILQMRHVRRLVKKHGDFVFGELRSFTN